MNNLIKIICISVMLSGSALGFNERDPLPYPTSNSPSSNTSSAQTEDVTWSYDSW